MIEAHEKLSSSTGKSLVDELDLTGGMWLVIWLERGLPSQVKGAALR
ncbi:MAG: hypothetical protein AOA65_1213 [Candidatus Bathyarchaeota archaeon BA1]|nr:MAG: hypothetical protein AOA65_1213 [Candidatus Bathyarchaeota archaeon BA1]